MALVRSSEEDVYYRIDSMKSNEDVSNSKLLFDDCGDGRAWGPGRNLQSRLRRKGNLGAAWDYVEDCKCTGLAWRGYRR